MEPGSGDDAPFPERLVRLSLPDLVLDLTTEPGLFSHRRIDPGTEILLRDAPRPPACGNLLDLGCGYGAIALALAIRAPRATVWAIDVDDRALQAVERKVQRAGLDNVVSCTPREIPADRSFSAIYSNPPTRIGKWAPFAPLTHWLTRLETEATAYLVIKKSAGADSTIAALTEARFRAKRSTSRRGYRIIEVER